MQQEFLFEIGTEEIPAGYIRPALENMKQIMAAKLDELKLTYEGISGVTTPRRLTLCVKGLAGRQQDRQEEVLGPPKKAAFNADNQPTKAAIGFAKSRGAAVEDLQVVTTPRGEYLMLLVKTKGQDTIQILADILPQIITEIPFPKSMRWGSGRTSFARPIQWLLAIYDDQVVPCKIDNIPCDNVTRGHRFMAPASIAIKDYDHYLESLRQAYVIAKFEERREAVINEINRAAREVGGRILPDNELVNTVANLVEAPYAVCGTFEKRFLALPREVLITSMREHQKYFAITDENNNLLPHFVAVNNTKVENSNVAAEGHQRVLRARLEDALFFFKEDKKHTLEKRVNDLGGVIFQAKLGTLLEKTKRITDLAGHLAQSLSPNHLETVKRAAYLAKADLLTEMVNEFPSLQGVIGRDYAVLNGETEEVAGAIPEHYMPVRAGGELPATIPGSLISLADRFDTIVGCFGIGQTPTGTADPFGLRRLALGLLHIIADQGFTLSLSACIDEALNLYGDKLTEDQATAGKNVLEFIKGRFTNDLIGDGIPVETVEAVTSVSFDDVVDCRKRINALADISVQPSFTLLAGAFKRVMNIIKDNTAIEIDENLLTEEAEKKLYETFQSVTAEAHPFLAKREYNQALTAILKMKEPVDAFFDHVMVMVDDQAIRNNRLALLTAIAKLFLKVGDFSKMYALNQG